MKLIMTLLVRNEAEIVEANLDYHLAQGVDFVIVTDHGSSDGTEELLHPYERDGTALVLREEGDEHHQSVRVTRMARMALHEYGADWVMHNDADEFWWPLAGDLHDVFAAVPPRYGQLEVRRRNFVPRPDGDGPFYARLCYKETNSINPSGDPLEAKVAHRAHPGVAVSPGNHWIIGADLPVAPPTELLEIFHFPMRSYAQFERKVLQVGTGLEKLPHRSPDVGRDQLKLLQIYRGGGLPRYWEDKLLDQRALATALGAGEIELDSRFADFMHALESSGSERGLSPRPPSEAVLTDALSAVFERDAALADSRAELAAAGEALRGARAETARLQAELASVRAELISTAQALRIVQQSRMMRWTAPLRRAWYRRR